MHFTVTPSSAVVAVAIKVEHNGENDVHSVRRVVSSSGEYISVKSAVIVECDKVSSTSGTVELLGMMVHLVKFLSASLIVHFRVTLAPTQTLTLLGVNSICTLSA